MHSYIQRIMRLVRKTGDRVIVTDSRDPEESFVLMSFDDYELLMKDRFEPDDPWLPGKDDFEDAYDEAIPEIEMEDWQEDDEEGDDEDPAEMIKDEGSWRGGIPLEAYAEEEGGEEDDTEEDEALDSDEGYGTIRTAERKRPKKRKNWQIPPEIKRGSEAVEEDRYYLENV